MNNAQIRRRAVAVMEPRYVILYKGYKCYYCGDPADSFDHSPAISVAYAYGSAYFEKKRIPLVKVSCCRQCNSILGGRGLNTLSRRARHVYDRLQKKYEKYIQMTEWDADEIAELNGWLKQYVQTQSDFKLYMERRFQYMEDLHYDIL